METQRTAQDGTATVKLALRPPSAAAALGISLRTLTLWTKAGAIPCVRLRGVVLYPVDMLREWLREGAVAGRVDFSENPENVVVGQQQKG